MNIVKLNIEKCVNIVNIVNIKPVGNIVNIKPVGNIIKLKIDLLFLTSRVATVLFQTLFGQSEARKFPVLQIYSIHLPIIH